MTEDDIVLRAGSRYQPNWVDYYIMATESRHQIRLPGCNGVGILRHSRRLR